jgi:hypothetical protein
LTQGRPLGDAVRARAGLLAGHREGRDLKELAREFGFSVRTAEAIIRLEHDAPPTRRPQTGGRSTSSRPRAAPTAHEIVGAVWLIADLTGGVPTSEAYSQRAAELDLPSLGTVCATFGTWAEALRAAGMTSDGSRERA